MWIVLSQSWILSDSSDSFCEIEHLLSMVYFSYVIIINNNTGDEVLSEPLLKIFLEEFGWRSVNKPSKWERK